MECTASTIAASLSRCVSSALASLLWTLFSPWSRQAAHSCWWDERSSALLDHRAALSSRGLGLCLDYRCLALRCWKLIWLVFLLQFRSFFVFNIWYFGTIESWWRISVEGWGHFLKMLWTVPAATASLYNVTFVVRLGFYATFMSYFRSMWLMFPALFSECVQLTYRAVRYRWPGRVAAAEITNYTHSYTKDHFRDQFLA